MNYLVPIIIAPVHGTSLNFHKAPVQLQALPGVGNTFIQEPTACCMICYALRFVTILPYTM